MAGLGDFIDKIIPEGSTVGLIMIVIIIGTIAVVLLGLVMMVVLNKKRWNLKIEIKLPRSDGKIVNAEWGKGHWNAKRGVVYIKRPGLMQPKIPLKIFDPKIYLQGTDIITVVQLSPIDYRPVLPHSFLEVDTEYVDEKTGEVQMMKESVLNIKCDTGHDKAWQTAFEMAAKKAYSLQSFFNQFQTPIALGIVVVCVFVGIAALWTQI